MVEDERIAGMLYLNDSVDKIEGVGKIAKQRLNSNGIYTVGDLHGLHSAERLIVEIAKGCQLHQSSSFLITANISHMRMPHPLSTIAMLKIRTLRSLGRKKMNGTSQHGFMK